MYRTASRFLRQTLKKQIRHHFSPPAKPAVGEGERAETAVFDRPIIRDGKMWFTFTPKAGIDSFFMSVPPDFSCHNDLIATAIVSIFGNRFKTVRLDFEVSEHCVAALEDLAGIRISTTGAIEAWKAGSTPFLAFSGGFDSLAGYLLCPGSYKLASIDFGEKFERERAFFQTLDTTIIETDLRRAGDKFFHWLFMGAPLILYADHLDMGGIGFGTIFEASSTHLQPAGYRHPPARDLRSALGLVDYTITRGLTEFSTARIIHRLAPDLARASLKSLANVGSEKLYRKELLLCMELIRDGLATSEILDKVALPISKVKIGTSFALDFLYYAFASNGAYETVARVVDNPGALAEFRDTGIDMSWVYAYNPSFIDQIPAHMVAETLKGLQAVGIPMFAQAEHEGYSKFRDYWLSRRK